MKLSRRSVLTLAGGAVSAGALTTLSGCSTLPGRTPRTGSTGAVLRSEVPLPQPYTLAFRTPPVATPQVASGTGTTTGTGTTYLVRARAADLEILPGRTTRALTYDGSFPGPTIRARAGQETTVRLVNELDHPTVLHLHGGVTPPEHDGWPTDLLRPGQAREHVYPLEQRAATLWYHDHAADFTGPNVYAGLAGAFVLDDAAEDDFGLPRGERDVPVVISDRAFGPDAELAYPALDPERHHGGVTARYHGGVLGDCVLVNGVPWPLMEVDAARYRLRFLNGSNARRYELVLDGGATFVQVGTDQGLLERPWPRRVLTLAPGERADVVVDLSGYAPGSRLTMSNRAGEDGAARVMQLVVARRAHDDSRVPDRLTAVEPLDPSQVARTRDLHFALGPARHRGQGPGGTTAGHAAGHADGPRRRTRRWRAARCGRSTGSAGRTTATSPPRSWAPSSAGGCRPTSTTPSTSTSCTCRSTSARAGWRGRTRSTCSRADGSRCSCRSRATVGGTSCTATTWSTRT